MVLIRERLLYYKRKVILYAFFSPLIINLVGQIAVSEFFAIFDFLSFNNLRRTFKLIPDLSNITIAYLLFLISQFISDFVNNSNLFDEIRGWANIIMAAIVLIYLVKYLFVTSNFIIPFFAAQVIGILIFKFPDIIFDFNDTGSLKFYLAPMLNNIILCLAWYLISNDMKIAKYIVFFFIGYGFFCALFDYRSNGIFMILTGVLYHRRKLFLNLNLNKILKILIVFGILIQILYSIFVYQILSGNIVNERTKKQLNAIENPYNIANLLVNGRAETFVAIEAVKDKPFFGHGSWAPDPTGKYNYMISILQNDKEAFDREFVPEKGFIPSHSILLGAWMTSGLLGFLSVGYIVIIFLKASLNILKKPSSYVLPFLPIVIFFMINGFWTFLFSPLAHLRQTIPIMLAFVIVLNQKNYYKSQI